MTETARTYAIVLYELGIPEEMVREAVKLLKENPAQAKEMAAAAGITI